MTTTAPESLDFIRTIVTEDVRTSRHAGRVATRFPPEPNGYLHIGHAKSICLNFGLAREFGGSCNLRFDDTNPAKEDLEYVDSIMDDVQWLASTGTGAVLRLRLLRAALRLRRAPDQGGPGLRRRPDARGDPRVPRHADRAGQEQPVPRSPGRREPRPVRADAGRRVRGRLAGAARQDRHGVAEHQHARPGDLPDPAHRTHHRTGDAWCIYPMYDYAHPISDAIEKHHPLALHARVRGPPAALRLAARQPAGAVAPAADRIRPAEPDLHGDEQAQAAAARRREARLRLGRPAHADHRRPAPARLHARGDARLLRAHRRGQEGEHHRRRAPRALRARRPEPARAARAGGAAAAQGDHREPGPRARSSSSRR